jgi:hypothetical protein
MLTRTVTVIAHLRVHLHGRLLILSLILVQQACYTRTPRAFLIPRSLWPAIRASGNPRFPIRPYRGSLRGSPGESGFGRDRESGPDSDWQKNRGIGICVVTVPSVRVTVPRRRDGVHVYPPGAEHPSRASSMST